MSSEDTPDQSGLLPTPSSPAVQPGPNPQNSPSSASSLKTISSSFFIVQFPSVSASSNRLSMRLNSPAFTVGSTLSTSITPLPLPSRQLSTSISEVSSPKASETRNGRSVISSTTAKSRSTSGSASTQPTDAALAGGSAPTKHTVMKASIAGAVLGCAALVVALILFCLIRRRKRKKPRLVPAHSHPASEGKVATTSIAWDFEATFASPMAAPPHIPHRGPVNPLSLHPIRLSQRIEAISNIQRSLANNVSKLSARFSPLPSPRFPLTTLTKSGNSKSAPTTPMMTPRPNFSKPLSMYQPNK